jgi:non-SMC mitotic condensation complex subunit 1
MEIGRLVAAVREMKMSEAPEEYTEIMARLKEHPMKNDVLTSVFRNVDSPALFLSIACGFFSGEDPDPEMTLAILRFSRDLAERGEDHFDLLAKLAFLYAGAIKAFGVLEVKQEVLEVVELCAGKGVPIGNHAVSMLITGSPYVLMDIFSFLNKETLVNVMTSCIDVGLASTNKTLLRNLGTLLALCAEKNPLALDVSLLTPLVHSEHYFLRSSALECLAERAVAMKDLVEEGKCKGEMKAITKLVMERLVDINHYTRTKAIQALGTMDAKKAILRSMKKSMFAGVVERLTDKASIVRKRSILFFHAALETHPFVMDGGFLGKEVVEKCRGKGEEYFRECVAFCEVIRESLRAIYDVLLQTKSEITEIVEYITLCCMYEVEGALELFSLLFILVWRRESCLDQVIDGLRRLSGGESQNLLKKLLILDDSSLAFENIIRELSLRGVLNRDFVSLLFISFKKRDVQAARMIRRISSSVRAIVEENIEGLWGGIKYGFEQLSGAESLEGAQVAAEYLSECLTALGNLDYRLPHDSELIQSLVGFCCVLKRPFLSVVQSVVDTVYFISTNPDRIAAEFLDKLLASSVDKKIFIFAVGHIALKEAVHLERLERAWSERQPVHLREERSEEADAAKKRLSIDLGPIRERRLSVSGRRSAQMDEDQADMADRIFFAKEHEILYGETLISQLVDRVSECMDSDDLEVKYVSYVSVGKMMCISSVFCLRFIDKFTEGIFLSEDIAVLSVLVLADAVMAFSSLIGERTQNIFLSLDSKSARVRLSALVAIRHLLRSGMLKGKGKYWRLSKLLAEENQAIKASARALFEESLLKEGGTKVVGEIIKGYSREPGDEDALKTVFSEVLGILASVKAPQGTSEAVAKRLREWAEGKDPGLAEASKIGLNIIAVQ